MAGIFDSLITDDPRQQAYMALAAGLLAGRGSFNKVAGEALMGSQQTYRQAQAAKAQQEQQALHQQMLQMQIDQAQRDAKKAALLEQQTPELLASFPQNKVVAGPPTETGSYPMQEPGANDYMNWALKAYTVNPGLAQSGWKMADASQAREDKATLARETQAANAKASLERQQAAAQAAMDRLLEQIQGKKDLAAILAAAKPAPAPSLTTIVDPNDPSRMITVDARTFNPATKSGVIGVAGKEPAAALRQEKLAKGQQDAEAVITDLRTQYNTLEKNNAITSTTNNPIENAGAWIGSSPPGQLFGRVFGTESQSARNQILMKRPALVQAIFQATGMSAKSLDSNTELKLMLMTATDPTLDVQANRAALDALERKLASGEYNVKGFDKQTEKPANKPTVSNW